MQIDCGTLRRALKNLTRLVPKRPTTPLLEHVLFEPAENGVAIVATDITTRARVVVAAEDPIAMCLPAHALLAFANSVRSGGVEIEPGHRSARITSAGTTLELPALPPGDFPAAVAHDGIAAKLDDAAEFLDALGWVAEAVGTDVTRPHLMGVLVDGDRVVAVDGHRLHIATVSEMNCASVLVPVAAVGLIIQMFDGGALEISVGAGAVCFSTATWTVTARAVDEKFPPYQQVIPKVESAAFAMMVGSRDLGDGLRRTARRDDRPGVMPVRLRANGAIRLESASMDRQLAATVEVIDSTHTGADFVSGYNARYLRDAVAGVDDIATLRFFGAEDPLLIEMKNRVAVVMPYRM